MTKQHVLDVVIVVEVNPPRATLGEQCDSTLSTVRDSASRYLEYARDHRSLIATDRFGSRAAIHRAWRSAYEVKYPPAQKVGHEVATQEEQ